VHKDIKKAIYHKDNCASESSRVIDNIFSLNDETAKFGTVASLSYDHHHNRKPEESENASSRNSIGTRSQKLSHSKPVSAEEKETKATEPYLKVPDKDAAVFKHPKDVQQNSSANSRKQT